MDTREQVLKEVQNAARIIDSGGCRNEANARTRIIDPIFKALGWDKPPAEIDSEYPVEGNESVDYALLDLKKPEVFVEAKAPGKIKFESVEQLFQYGRKADRAGKHVPLLVLTDGKEWRFYLSSGAGDYDERLFHRIDNLAHSIENNADALCDFLSHREVVSGNVQTIAHEIFTKRRLNARTDRALLAVWPRMLKEANENLCDILVEEIQDSGVIEPDREIVKNFLRSQSGNLSRTHTTSTSPIGTLESQRQPRKKQQQTTPQMTGFVYKGESYRSRNASDVLRQAVALFANDNRNNDFLPRLKERAGSDRKNLVSQNKYELFPNAPHLVEKQTFLLPLTNNQEWWLNLNHSRVGIVGKLEICCEVAGLEFGTDDFRIIYADTP